MQLSQMSQRQAATKIQARVRGRAARRPRPAAGGRPTLAWAIEEVVAGNTGAGLEAEIDRERLCCDILNTAVMGALVGGFALSNMTSSGDGNTLDNLIYLFSCLSVHACTCSCLTSALLYRTAVRMRDDAVAAWAAAHKLLLMLPLAKFGMGCVSYLLSVILLSFRDLDHSSTFQYTCLIIGVMSMCTVCMTVAVVAPPTAITKAVTSPLRPKPRKARGSGSAHGADKYAAAGKRVAPLPLKPSE